MAFLSLFSRHKKEYPRSIFKHSRLRQRILAINLAVLIIPIIGVMWAGTYRQSLIESELSSLQSEANLYATALAESALFVDSTSWTKFDIPSSQYLLRRMVTASSNVHARLWNYDGKAILDSRVIAGPNRVHTEKLREIGFMSQLKHDFNNFLYRQFLHLAWLFSNLHNLPITNYASPPYNIDNFPEVEASLYGESQPMVRRSINKDYSLQLSVAVPVQRYKRVYGSLQLMRSSEAIDQALAILYKRLFIIFLLATIMMIILSFWLAHTIAAPLYKLTNAANYIRTHKDRKGEIPDLSHRKDEIGQLSTNLRSMTEALWQRMDAIESFAADVSHELKNPLTSLKSAVETLQFAKKAEQTEKLKTIINQDVGRLNRLITDISDASRLDAELSRSQGEIIDFKKLSLDIYNLYKETITAENHIHFEFIDLTASCDIFVKANGDRITQIIRNLISNAISFSPPQSQITLTLKIKASDICLDIQDEGPGIAEHALEKIFERFYTERPKAEAFGNHSGLGLSISRQIAQNYNGSLTASNRKDGKTGAIFHLILPLTTSAP